MARRVFFSFHYQRDIFRVNQVRKAWEFVPGSETEDWYDASLWEKTKLKSEQALQNLINQGLNNTSVTVVLIGAKTSERKWVKYEIQQSYIRNNGLLGIYIHKLLDRGAYGKADQKGVNPFECFYVEEKKEVNLLGKPRIQTINTPLSELYPTYDWVSDNGYENIGKWIEKAAIRAGR